MTIAAKNIGVVAVLAGQTIAWPLFGKQKDDLLQIRVHAYVDNKFYNEPTSLCRFQHHANSSTVTSQQSQQLLE